MKCPACGFETPDVQDWCDFCKEPLRKKKPARDVPSMEPGVAPSPGSRGALPAAEAPAQPVRVSDEVWQRLLALRAGGAPGAASRDGAASAIPPEFAGLDTGGSLPPVPTAARQAAWVFLAICVFWIFAAVIWLLRNSDRIASRAAAAPIPAASSPSTE